MSIHGMSHRLRGWYSLRRVVSASRFGTRAVLIAGFAALPVGCGEPVDSKGSVVFRDSVGVSIAENIAPAWGEGDAWTVDSMPALVIGLLDGPQEYVLDGIAGATRLSDGSIVIGQRHEVRYFDSAGQHIRTVGRRGQAEGEFGSVNVVRLQNDSVAIIDLVNQRLTVLDGHGQLVQSMALPQPMTALNVRGVLADGSYIGTAPGRMFRQVGVPSAEWDSMTVLRFRAGDTAYDTINTVRRVSSKYSRDFAPTGVIAGSQSGYWYGDGELYEFSRYDVTGGVSLIVRAPVEPIPVSARARERFKEMQAQFASNGRPQPEASIPEFHAPYRIAMTDTEQNLWVWSPLLYEDAPLVWRVFGPNGEMLGQLTLPTGGVPFEIGSDYVLTREWDEYHVEYLHLYRLLKP